MVAYLLFVQIESKVKRPLAWTDADGNETGVDASSSLEHTLADGDPSADGC